MPRPSGVTPLYDDCRHKCHDPESPLNPWVKSCPVCGCANPAYDPEAQPDQWILDALTDFGNMIFGEENNNQ